MDALSAQVARFGKRKEMKVRGENGGEGKIGYKEELGGGLLRHIQLPVNY